MKWDPSLENRAMATDEEMAEFIKNMDFTIKLEVHQGPHGPAPHIVLYFTPFTGKYANYVKRWEAKPFIVNNNGDYRTRRGPGGRSIYLGLAWHVERRVGLNSHTVFPHYGREGYPNKEFVIRTSNERCKWRLRGANSARVQYICDGENKISSAGRCYKGSGVPASIFSNRTAWNFFKDIYPLSYGEALKGYKVLFKLPDLITWDLNNGTGYPWSCSYNRKGFIGAIIHDNVTYLSSNYYYGQHCIEHQNTIWLSTEEKIAK